MTSLYNLATQHQQALSRLEEMDLPAEVVRDTIESLSGELEAKCESVAMWRENQLVIAKAKKEAAKRLTDQAKAIENRANSMIEYLDNNMRKAGITEIDCDYFTIKYAKNPPSVNITHESNIPRDYIKVTTIEAPDKAKIKKAIQSGIDIDGAELVQGERLVIK